MAYRKRSFGRRFKKGFKRIIGRVRRSFGGMRRRFARVKRSSGFASRGGVLRGG